MSDDISERVASVEQIAASAHKRLDEHGLEIISLRETKLIHTTSLQKHESTIANHTSILEGIEKAVKELTEVAISFKAMVIMGLFLGSIFVSICGFVGGKLLNWW